MELDKHNLDNLRLVCSLIDSGLQHAHISLEKISFEIGSTNYIVSVDKEVPENIELDICKHARYKGLTIQFRTSLTG